MSGRLGAVVMAFLVGGGGCALSTSHWNEDKVVHSRPVEQPSSEFKLRAKVEAQEPSTLMVHALKESLCTRADEETVERTAVTARTPKAWSAPVAGVGVLITILGLVFDYKYVHQSATAADPVRASDLIYLHTAGGLAIGQYFVARLLAGESREAPVTLTRTVNQVNRACGESPSPDVYVRVTNGATQSKVEARANAQGLATFSLASGDASFLKGWQCRVGGCAPPSYAVAINGTEVGPTTAPTELDASQKERRAAEAGVARMQEALRQAAAERERATERFRQTLNVGDQTHCGMIIEMKKPIVKVQAPGGDRWLRLDQVLPPGRGDCVIDTIGNQYLGP